MTDKIITIIYWIMVIPSAIVIIALGKLYEKIFYTFITLCSVLSEIIYLKLGLNNNNIFYMYIDFFVLIYILCIAYKYDSHWPIWFSGFQSISVLTYAAQLYFPNKLPLIYIKAEDFWSIPTIMSMTIGVWLDHRAGLNVRQ